ncbi:MAG: hypothetical protein MUC63_07700, partial [Planctomycetes bacterium]|nr:hypothetical protein [Planctomycetota bacterium]
SVGFRGAVYGKAAFSWGEQAAPLPEGGFARVRVPKGSRGRCRVDLSRLDFLCEYGPLESKGPAGVFEILSRAGSWKVFVELRFPAEARRNPLRSNEQYFYLREPPDAPIAGLLLELSADRASLLAGEPVEFLLRLRNVGALPRIVCARLEGPDLLRYHVLDLEPENKLRESKDSPSVEPRNRKDDPFADDSGEAVVVDWTSPNRDTMEPLSRSDFVELAPGRAVERRLDISRLFRRDFPAGKYLLRIRYVNRSDGLRLGLRVPASIGILTSNGIEIQVR